MRGFSRTKSNDLKETIMKKHVLLFDILTGVKSSKLTTRQKLSCVCFGLSIAAIMIAGASWLTLPALVALFYFSVQIKNIDIEE